MIHADVARKLTKKSSKEADKKALDTLMSLINRAVGSSIRLGGSATSVSVKAYRPQTVLLAEEKLKELGYTVTHNTVTDSIRVGWGQ